MNSQTNYLYTYNVGMTCNGCSNAIKRILGAEQGKIRIYKLKLFAGLISFETNVPEKRLTVVGPDGLEDLLIGKLQKWVRFISFDNLIGHSSKEGSRVRFEVRNSAICLIGTDFRTHNSVMLLVV